MDVATQKSPNARSRYRRWLLNYSHYGVHWFLLLELLFLQGRLYLVVELVKTANDFIDVNDVVELCTTEWNST